MWVLYPHKQIPVIKEIHWNRHQHLCRKGVVDLNMNSWWLCFEWIFEWEFVSCTKLPENSCSFVHQYILNTTSWHIAFMMVVISQTRRIYYLIISAKYLTVTDHSVVFNYCGSGFLPLTAAQRWIILLVRGNKRGPYKLGDCLSRKGVLCVCVCVVNGIASLFLPMHSKVIGTCHGISSSFVFWMSHASAGRKSQRPEVVSSSLRGGTPDTTESRV